MSSEYVLTSPDKMRRAVTTNGLNAALLRQISDIKVETALSFVDHAVLVRYSTLVEIARALDVTPLDLIDYTSCPYEDYKELEEANAEYVKKFGIRQIY